MQSAQMEDLYLKKKKEKVEVGINSQVVITEDGILMMGDRMCVPDT